MDTLHTLIHALDQIIGKEATSIALGITFGIKGLTSPALTEEIRITGISHLMVLSGANITMFLEFIYGLLFVLPIRTRHIASMILVALFLFMIPIQPSVLRAILMCYLPRIGLIIGKKTHSIYLLLLSCALILTYNIHYLNDISFQLSFLAVFGILLYYKSSNHSIVGSSIVYKLRRGLSNQFSLAIAAQTFTLPLIFLYFGNISLLGAITSALLAPLISPIMILTVLTVLLTQFSPLFANYSATILKVLTDIVILTIHQFAQLKSLYIQY